MTLDYGLLVVLGVIATLLAALLRTLHVLDANWRPIIRAYLEAKVRALGQHMRVPTEDDSPGHVWAPTDDEPEPEPTDAEEFPQ